MSTFNFGGGTNGTNVADPAAAAASLNATPQNYTSLADLIDPTKPDVRDLYVQTYGDQGITGFLELTGAKKNAGTSDKVEWYEEGRLPRLSLVSTTKAMTKSTLPQVTLMVQVLHLHVELMTCFVSCGT